MRKLFFGRYLRMLELIFRFLVQKKPKCLAKRKYAIGNLEINPKQAKIHRYDLYTLNISKQYSLFSELVK